MNSLYAQAGGIVSIVALVAVLGRVSYQLGRIVRTHQRLLQMPAVVEAIAHDVGALAHDVAKLTRADRRTRRRVRRVEAELGLRRRRTVTTATTATTESEPVL